jgi:putative oxidoreductase
MMQMISFMKNVTIAGGFLVLAGSGPGALALDNVAAAKRILS